MDRIKTKGHDRETSKRYYREYMRERRAMRKDLRLCIQCGKQAEEGKTLCSECHEKQAERQRRYYTKTKEGDGRG